MKKIDLESHFYSASFLEVYTERAERKDLPYYDKENNRILWSERVIHSSGEILNTLLELGEKRIAHMDKWGVDMAVISHSMGLEQLPTEVSVPTCAAANKQLYAFIQKFPGSFLGSAILPVNDVTAACAELERCVKDYGFVSWHAHSNFGAKAPDWSAKTPDQEEFRPIFKQCEKLGVYVYLHPNFMLDDRIEEYGFGFAGPGLGFAADTLITIMRMILGGLFDEFPKLKVVLGHLGEAIPFLLERIDNRMAFIPSEQAKNKQPISYYFKNNIMVTTSGNMSKEAFQCAKNVLGMDHIALGTDYPYEKYDEMMGFIESLPLAKAERDMLNSKSALDFLNLNLFKKG
ncbi:hypothetical protein UNSWDHB_449 [Dehalobacter sp. UNSWDHB]|uniref:amidohydrolase family protein n=1 Tax=Dehalobacter sp. UNSWDHB TaxID=1339256 RepID=UPI0003878334|nr:amidohydrolase family protein [Dehalobacter sp. UNSWDHB]EQB22233.1 hypothetical protein UNSWDHB_449 [Dehalobacter sp. UNSWDHB]